MYTLWVSTTYTKKIAKSSQQRTSKTNPNGPNPLSPLLSQLNTQSEPDYNTHILKRIPSHSLSNWNFVQNCTLCGHIHTTPKPNTRTNKQSKWRHIGIFRLPTAKPKDKRRIKKSVLRAPARSLYHPFVSSSAKVVCCSFFLYSSHAIGGLLKFNMFQLPHTDPWAYVNEMGDASN